MAKTRITKRTIILLVILGVLLIGSGVGYLLWRVSEEEGLAPEDSEASEQCNVPSCPEGFSGSYDACFCGDQPVSGYCCGDDPCPDGGTACDGGTCEDGRDYGPGCYEAGSCQDRHCAFCTNDSACGGTPPPPSDCTIADGDKCCCSKPSDNNGCGSGCRFEGTGTLEPGKIAMCINPSKPSIQDLSTSACSSYCSEADACSGENWPCPDGYQQHGTAGFNVSCPVNGVKVGFNGSCGACGNPIGCEGCCVPTDQPGPERKVCWDPCSFEGLCDDGTTCQDGRCRNPQCPDESSCQCGAVLSPQCVDVNQTLVRQLTGEIGRVDRFVTNFNDAGMEYTDDELDFEISINCVDDNGSPVSGVQITEIGGGGNSGSGPTFSFTDSDNEVELEFALQGITYASCAVTSVPILKGDRYPDADCAATVVISGDIPTPGEPDLRVQKTSNVYCIDEDTPNPKARVDYTIELTNPGSVPIQVDRVVDRPENIRTDWLLSGSIDPSYGEVAEDCSSGVCYITSIIWVLPEEDYGNIVYPPDSTDRQTKSFRYSVIIPKDHFGSYHNVVTAYTPDDEYTDDEDIFATCKIPKTGLLDNVVGRVALGTMLLLIGLVYIWSNKFERVVVKFYPGEGVIKDERINDVRRKFQKKVLRSTEREKD